MGRISYVVCIVATVVFVNRILTADELRAGIAVVDITPPVPFRMAGGFVERLSTGVKDPLHAKAIVFQQEEEWAALVFCDLIGISSDVSSLARDKASAKTGIPADHIVIATTHAHTGPLFFEARNDYLHERHVARFGNDPYESSNYRRELVDKIVSAISDAKSSLQSVELRAGNAEETRLSFNRRFHLKDGTVRFNPGQLNSKIVRPAGPIDPQVGIVLIQEAKTDKPLGAIVSFAMHADTVGGTECSADYPKVVEDRLRQSMGSEFTLLFGAGACGDINDIDVTTSGRRGTEKLGTLLGETIATAVQQPNQLTLASPDLAMRQVIVNVPLQSYSEAEYAAAREKMKFFGTRDLPFLQQVEATKIVDLKRWPGDTVPLEIQAIRLSRETAIVTLPGEIFVELGLAIKAASPFKTTLVIELANESLGYIPTKKAFAEGSYETVNSRIRSGSGEQLVDAAVELLKKLQ